MTKVAYVEWPDGLIHSGGEWQTIVGQVKDAKADILVTNEMPFGTWRPTLKKYDQDEALEWMEEHERAMDALSKLDVAAIISSRPIVIGDKLVNEAFALENGAYKTLHQKHFFPAEDGWHEASWFQTKERGFEVHKVAGIIVGVQLCTELMYNEHAREYGKLGADLIVAPRASGKSTLNWDAAGAMSAVVSGCYVISSNRSGSSSKNVPNFGGHGFCYAPGGEKIGSTSDESPTQIITLDKDLIRKTQSEYPCYLRY